MWVDGLEIEKDEHIKHCYTINNGIFLTDKVGKVLFAFDSENGEKIEKKDINIAQSYIFRYDVIKKIQEGCS